MYFWNVNLCLANEELYEIGHFDDWYFNMFNIYNEDEDMFGKIEDSIDICDFLAMHNFDRIFFYL